MVILLFLLLAFSASAQQAIAPVGYREPTATNLACCPASATYIITEGFEGVGAPSGWSDVITAPADYDYLDNPLDQSQSLRLLNGAIAKNKTWHSGMSEVWYYFKWKRVVTVDNGAIFYVIDGSENPLLYVSITGPSHVVQVGLGGATATASDATSDGVTYHFWVHYKKGTGSDAVFEVHYSTTPTKPADGSGGHAKVIGGSSTADATGIWFYSEYSTTDWRVDRVRADDEPIGSDPT